MWWMLLLAAVALLSLALVVLGLRGRRVDEHPLCRRCGFDLFGNPDAAVCGECGADLTRRKAVRIGHRARRRLPLAAGLALLVVAVLGGVGVTAAWRLDFDPQRYKPLAMLGWELESGSPARAGAAATELSRRLAAGDLDANEVNQAAAAVLRRQADLDQPWDGRLGDFVENARDAGTLSGADWNAFGRAGVRVELCLRRQVRVGDPLPLQFWLRPRLGTRPPRWQVGVQRGMVEIDGSFAWSDIESDHNVPWRTPEAMRGRLLAAFDVSPSFTAKLSPGPSVLRITYAEFPRDLPSRPSGFDDDGGLVIRRELEIPIVLLPADAPADVLNDDPALEARLRDAVRISDVHNGDAEGGAWDVQVFVADGSLPADWMARLKPAGRTGGAPVPAASRQAVKAVSVSGTRREWPTLPQRWVKFRFEALPPGSEVGGNVTLVIEPDVESALRSVPGEEPYARPMRFEVGIGDGPWYHAAWRDGRGNPADPPGH